MQVSSTRSNKIIFLKAALKKEGNKQFFYHCRLLMIQKNMNVLQLAKQLSNESEAVENINFLFKNMKKLKEVEKFIFDSIQ